MKKYITHVLLACLCSIGIHAQSMEDALRYARPELAGTARYIGMGGAFNALGGDFSAINDNPAGAAVFINSEFGGSLNIVGNKINTNYLGSSNNLNSDAFNISQFGAVFVLGNTVENGITKLIFAYNYQKTQSFDYKYNAIGTNPSRGIDNYFLNYAQGIPYRDIRTYDDESLSESYEYLGNNLGFGSQQAFLGFQSYIINPGDENDDNLIYLSNSNPQNQAVDHDFFVVNSGNNSKHTFNISAQFQENLYVGMNFNSHRTEFRRIDNLEEFNYGSDSNFNYTVFENELFTVGDGFSFQLGAIYKLKNNLRIGLSYQSSTWYNFTDELLQYIETSEGAEIDIIDPRIINVYEYQIKTPSTLSGGLAYVFGTKGLLSVQYDLTDYSNLKFNIGRGDNNLMNQNRKIERTLQSAGTLKLGAEYRIEKLSLRSGYFNRESINSIDSDLSKGYSFGLGYDFGGSMLSLGLFLQEVERSESMYQEGLTDVIDLNNKQSQFLVSYTIKL